MKKRFLSIICIVCVLTVMLTACGSKITNLEGHSLKIYCDNELEDSLYNVVKSFMSSTDCKVEIIFGSADQIKKTAMKDEDANILITSSEEETEYMDDIYDSKFDIAKHRLVIATEEGNPKGIKDISSLVNKDISIHVGNVKSTSVGMATEEVLDDKDVLQAISFQESKNIAKINDKEQKADVTILWKEMVNDNGMEILEGEYFKKYSSKITALVLKTSEDKEAVKGFKKYIKTDGAKNIIENFGLETN